jgi:hypothetical protein
MQMSRAALFVFLEGRVDRFFYSRVCESALAGVRILHEVVIAQELPGGTGGKPGLTAFFEYLEFKLALQEEFKGKRLAAMFCFDKDLDDYARRMKTSRHAVYTVFYDLENHLFHHGSLVEAAAAAADLDVPSIQALIPNPEAWRRTCAESWREWVKMCAFSQVRTAKCACNYGVTSRVNTSVYSALDPTLQAQFMNVLEVASRLQAQRFGRAFRRIARWVDEQYDAGRHDHVFKGKWYRGFIAVAVQAAAGGRAYNPNGLEDRLVATLAMSLDFTEPWASYFKDPVTALGNALAPPANAGRLAAGGRPWWRPVAAWWHAHFR